MRYSYATCFLLALGLACGGDSDRPVTGDGSTSHLDTLPPGVDGQIIHLRDGPLPDGPTVDTGTPSPDARVDGAQPRPDTLAHDTLAHDTLPPPRYLERTLAYSGTGASQWLHIFFRNPGATSINVRTLRINTSLVPPFASVATNTILAGQCKSATERGTFTDGTPFTTTITTCFNNDQATVSHVSAAGSNPPGAAQNHGTASVDPYNTTLPYERSLRFLGGGGAEWNHVARRSQGASTVDVETWIYNANLAPSTNTHNVTTIAAGACKNFVISGRLVSPDVPYSTRVEYCRAGTSLNIQHVSTIDGVTNPTPTVHGSIVIQ